jgi:peptide/nickel transport system permease protein
MDEKNRKAESRYLPYLKLIFSQFRTILQDWMGKIGFTIIAIFIIIAIFAPVISPEGPFKTYRRPDGRFAKMDPPSAQHWFGTTRSARDVFDQTIWGTRVAVSVGLLSALCITIIGTNIGIISGYYGGKVDDILMRITDVAYGIPFLPLCILLVALLKPSIWNILLAIIILFWRTTARVIRSQVLSLKERPFIWSAKAAGAGNLRIMYVHIAPNVLPLSLLYLALGVGWAVMTEASLSFIGLGDPLKMSWGYMLYYAFQSAAMRKAWWWIIPPGASIALFVVSCFLVGRAYEEIVNPRLRGR